MKIQLFITLIVGIIQAGEQVSADSDKPDFGQGKWMAYNTNWKKFSEMKKGVRFIADACDVRLRYAKNEVKTAQFLIEWEDDEKFKIWRERSGVYAKGKKKGEKRTGYNENFKTFTLTKIPYKARKQLGQREIIIPKTAWVERKVRRRNGRFQRNYMVIWLKAGETEVKLTTAIETAKTCSTPGQFTSDNDKPKEKKNSGEYFDLCGTGISETCKGVEVSMDDEGWQQITDEATDIGLAAIKIGIMSTTSKLSFKALRGINSGRCALTNGMSNAWNLIGAVYYLAMEYGYDEKFETLVNTYYPYECTCTEEIANLSKSLGSGKRVRTVMAGCSEKVQITAANNLVVEGGGVPEDSIDEEDDQDDKTKDQPKKQEVVSVK